LSSKVAARCRGLAVALLAIGAVVSTSSAHAGTYDVLACDAAPGGSVRSWSYWSNDENIAAPADCPSGGSATRGLGVFDAPNDAVTSTHGQYGSWAFNAPAGTTIDGVLADYKVERWDQAGWWGGWGADSKLILGCYPNVLPNNCAVGTTPGTSAWIATAGARGVNFAAGCDHPAYCTHGWDGNSPIGAQITVFVRSATVRVNDASAPTVGITGGGLSGANGVVAGVQSVSYDASDNVGIKGVSFAIDGVARGSTLSSCDYAKAVPCANLHGASQSFDTSSLPDGEHTLTVTGTDTANNQRVSSVARFTSDNTAPAHVAVVADEGERWQSGPSFGVHWTNPSDGGSAVGAAHYQLCSGATCEPVRTASGAGISSLSGVTVPHEGDWTLRVWLEDQAGNTDSANASEAVHLRYDREAPAAVDGLTVTGGESWRSQNSFDLTWTNPEGELAPIAGASYELCSPNGECRATAVNRGGIDSLSGVATPAPGDSTLRVKLVDEAGNIGAASAPIHLRFDDAEPGVARPRGSDRWLNAGDVANGYDEVVGPAAAPLSGIAGYAVTANGAEPGSSTTVGPDGVAHLSSLRDGEVTIKARAISNSGVASSQVGTAVLLVDATAPKVSVAGTPDPDDWQPGTVALAISATDQPELSGMEGGHVSYSVDGGPVQHVAGPRADVSVSGDGEHTLSYSATDLAGNRSGSETVSFRIDSTHPVSPDLEAPTGWLTSDAYTVDASVAATPLSGVAGFSFTTDGSEPDATVDATSGRIALDGLREGTTVVKVRTVSGSGLVSVGSASAALRVDRTPPGLSVSSAPDDDTWIAGPAEIAISASDELSGVSQIVYRVDDGDDVRMPGDSAAIIVEEAGAHTVSYYGVDAAGNRSATQVVRFKIDGSVPGRPTVDAPSGWFSPVAGRYTLRIGAGGSAPESGIAGYAVTTDGSEPGTFANTASDGAFSIEDLPEGVTVIRARAVSGAGVASPDAGKAVLRVDRNAPAVRVAGASEEWQSDAVDLQLSAEDQAELSGVARITYRVDDGEHVSVDGDAATVRVMDDGRHTVRFRATDGAGNESEEQAVTVLVDRTAPTVEDAGGADASELLFDVSDATSGLNTGGVEMRAAGHENWESLRSSLDDGRLRAVVDPRALAGSTYEFRAIATDLAGNRTASRTLTRVFPARPVQVPAPAAAPVPPTTVAPAKPRPVSTAKPKPRPKRCTRKSRSRRCRSKAKHRNQRQGGRKRR
jgi:hypothetical protein